ncbi:MAG: methyltransferase domain-containing protein [Acidimicrobiia bacterium]|nr:methyltransferase domain-containing protein [Acidimicrobiia bacterium]
MSDIHDQVADYYRRAVDAGRDEQTPVDDPRWGTSQYADGVLDEVPDAATGLSMGCGNPHAMADLAPGETVLDLGSGGGIDVILSAKRVGREGRAYGVDFLDEMLETARANAAEAGVDNVEFLAGTIEDVPLPEDSVDVVISNCVINLAPDKAPVFAEMARVLRPGGRVAVSDVIRDDGTAPVDPVDGQAWAECGAGGLLADEYRAMLEAAGFEQVSIEATHQTGEGFHAATVRAVRSG